MRSRDDRRTPASARHERRALRLADRIPVHPRVLFVGINPGLVSARVNHHFAGPSNRFWKLLHESGLTPERLSPYDDHRMMSWGYGLTNLVPRATAGIDTLARSEYVDGLRVLRRKIRRVQPRIVALIGITLYREIVRVAGRLTSTPSGRPAAITPGVQTERLEGVPVFVLPNPSGRNAHFSYDEMLAVYRALAACATVSPPEET